MKTHVKVSKGGYVISDDNALDYAKAVIGLPDINVGTVVMLDAFRVLRKRGDIEELTVSFSDGEPVRVDKNGTLEDWPQDDPIVSVAEKLLGELAGWN